jgi:hypothetical protein
MTAEVEQLVFDYAELEPVTRRFVQDREEQIHNLARMTATSIRLIGKCLTEVKERLEHGQFLRWIGHCFAWKRTTAWAFMNVYDRFKCSNFEQMDIDVSALYLIAAPKTPEPVRNDVIRRAENGEKITHQGVRALVQEFGETGVMPEVEVDLRKLIEQRKKLLAPDPEPQPELTPEERSEREARAGSIRANVNRCSQVMTLIRAIEAFSEPPLSMEQLAEEIREMDTPDKDWCGQVPLAHAHLRELAEELKR